MTVNTKVDVAIVGGGPGGLAAANAIRTVRPDLNVRVYERMTAMRLQGNLFSFFPNGQSALSAINPAILNKAREYANDFTGFRLTDFETVDEFPPPHKMMNEAFGMDTAESMLLAWFIMRDTLASFLPQEQICLGYSLDDLTIDDSGTARLTFANKDEVVEAKLVIGCDGNKSVVRKCIFNDGDPKMMGTVIARGILDAPPDWPHPRGFLNAFNSREPRSQLVASYLAKGTDLLGWNSLLPLDLVTEKDVAASSYHGGQTDTDPETKSCWLEALESWPQYLRNLVEKTPLGQFSLHRQTYRDSEDIKKWGEGCVTLLGDSAHLATPALGLGVSMAMEDAAELGRAIGELGPTEEALRKYEQVRMPRVAKVHEASIMVFRQLVEGENKEKFGKLQLDWHLANPWCATEKFEPLVAAKMLST